MTRGVCAVRRRRGCPPDAGLPGGVQVARDLQTPSVRCAPRWWWCPWICALALLGANLLIGVVLLGVTVTLCVRGMKGQNASPRYKHLRLPKVAEDDYERGAMGRYSD